MNVSFSVETAKPNTDVNLQIDTKPNSQVGLLAMDTGLIAFGGNENDITPAEVKTTFLSDSYSRST